MDKKREWEKANTTRMSFKFQNSTDADILAYLRKQPSMQGAIKEALRERMRLESEQSPDK